MTIINSSDIVNYCEACELEYVGHQCARCPLSPLRARLEDAEHEITKSEPYRILDDVVRLEMQARINNLASFGWTLADFRVGHQARLYAKFRGGNGCHHVGTPPLMAGVGGFFTIRCQR